MVTNTYGKFEMKKKTRLNFRTIQISPSCKSVTLVRTFINNNNL